MIPQHIIRAASHNNAGTFIRKPADCVKLGQENFMVQRHVHIHGSRFAPGLCAADQGEEQILALLFIIAFQQFLTDAAVPGCLRQKLLVVERDIQLFGQQLGHIAAAGSVLSPYGNDRLILH